MSPAPVTTNSLVDSIGKATKPTPSKKAGAKNGGDFANVLDSVGKATQQQVAQSAKRPTAKGDTPHVDKPEAKAKVEAKVKTDKPAERNVHEKTGGAADKSDAPADDTTTPTTDTDSPTVDDEDFAVDSSTAAPVVAAETSATPAAAALLNVAVNQAVVATTQPTTDNVVPTSPGVTNAVSAATAPLIDAATRQDADATTATATPTTAPAPVPTDASAPVDNGTNSAQTTVAGSPDLNDLMSTLTPVTGAEANKLTAAVNDSVKKDVGSVDAAATKAALDSLSSSTKVNDAAQTTTAATKLVSNTMQTEPYHQVVKLVAPLKHAGDGDYSMTLKLHPQHLGSVEITVALSSGQINMSMNSDNPAARQMLRDSMQELRTALEQSGINAGSLDVGSNNAQNHGTQNNGNSASSTGGGATGQYLTDDTNDDFGLARFAAAIPAAAVSDGNVDVRV